MGSPASRHSSITNASAAGSSSRYVRWRDESGKLSSRRPAGLRMRSLPSLPTTSRPEERLSTISLLRRSDASARADISRSCAFSFVTASCSAAVTNALSVVLSLRTVFESRAAAANRSMANMRTPTSAATMAVRPMTARTEGFIAMSSVVEGGVPLHDAVAHSRGDERTDGEEGAERERVFHVAALEHDHPDADDRADERR